MMCGMSNFNLIGVQTALFALDRAIPDAGSADAKLALAGSGTALFWACAVDEQLRVNSEYLSIRNGDPIGRLIAGLKLGRNAVAHGVAVVSLPSQQATFPLEFPLTIASASWADYSVVRAGLDREPRPSAREVWESGLAGKSAPGILAEVHEWLSRLAYERVVCS